MCSPTVVRQVHAITILEERAAVVMDITPAPRKRAWRKLGHNHQENFEIARAGTIRILGKLLAHLEEDTD